MHIIISLLLIALLLLGCRVLWYISVPLKLHAREIKAARRAERRAVELEQQAIREHHARQQRAIWEQQRETALQLRQSRKPVPIPAILHPATWAMGLGGAAILLIVRALIHY
jgi:hypothetical protein